MIMNPLYQNLRGGPAGNHPVVGAEFQRALWKIMLAQKYKRNGSEFPAGSDEPQQAQTGKITKLVFTDHQLRFKALQFPQSPQTVLRRINLKKS